jgi:hypothetical protein
LNTDQLEPQPEALPKKRGRKKKQHVTATPPAGTITAQEDSFTYQNTALLGEQVEAEPSREKPKKKRGRPRKLEPLRATEEAVPELLVANKLPDPDSPPNEDKQDGSATVPSKQGDSEEKVKGMKKKATEEVEGTESKEDRLPLKEMDSNLTSPTKPESTEESPTKPGVEHKKEKSTPNKQLKETPKLSATQSKITYRVGLSKRSRIAPLLKSIKK